MGTISPVFFCWKGKAKLTKITCSCSVIISYLHTAWSVCKTILAALFTVLGSGMHRVPPPFEWVFYAVHPSLTCRPQVAQSSYPTPYFTFSCKHLPPLNISWINIEKKVKIENLSWPWFQNWQTLSHKVFWQSRRKQTGDRRTRDVQMQVCHHLQMW